MNGGRGRGVRAIHLACAAGASFWALASAGCSSSSNGSAPDSGSASTPDDGGSLDSTTEADSASPDGNVADGRAGGGGSGDASSDATAGDAGIGSAAPFSLLVAESPPGPTIAQNLWGGVLRYTFTTDDAGPGDAGGIDASEVADPVGLAFRPASAEVFVGNRHGNTAGDGVAGSVSRFVWNGAAQTFTPNGAITGNGLNSVTQVAFNPVSGELFAANYTGTGGVSRFTFDSQGNAAPNGTIGSGAALGVNIAADGKRLYLTNSSSNTVRQFDLGSGTELAAVTVSSTTQMQQIALRGSSELYIASPYNNTVYRFTLDASDNPVLKESITGADAPVGLAISPDGLELFTGGHLNADIVDRYQYNAQSDSWTPTTKFNAPASLGYFLILGDLSSDGGSTVDAASDAASE